MVVVLEVLVWVLLVYMAVVVMVVVAVTLCRVRVFCESVLHGGVGGGMVAVCVFQLQKTWHQQPFFLFFPLTSRAIRVY